MSRRIDYYDDPAAPKANSLVPSVNVVVVNEAGDVLMIRRSDNDNWAVPGGAIDLGESMVQAAVRETREETGIECEITGLDRDLHRPETRDLVHQQRGGPAGVLHPAHRCSDRRAAHAEQREQRSAMGSAGGRRRVSDGPVDADADRALPGRSERLAVSRVSSHRLVYPAVVRGCGRGRGRRPGGSAGWRGGSTG